MQYTVRGKEGVSGGRKGMNQQWQKGSRVKQEAAGRQGVEARGRWQV